MGKKSCSKFLRNLVTTVHFTDRNWNSKTVYCSYGMDQSMPEAATAGILQKKLFLKMSQYSQENTSAGVFLMKLQA